MISSAASGSAAARSWPSPAYEHLARLGEAEHVERERHCPLGGHQPGHIVAAGHHDQGARRAGQQRAHLGHAAGVVQDDQHPLAVQQAAEQGGPAFDVGRDPVRRHAQRVEEEPQRLGRLHRRGGRIQSAQVDVQLAVREALGDVTTEADGERGLPRSRRARDDDDRHRLGGFGRASTGGFRRQHRLQDAEFFVTAGKARRVEGQLAGTGVIMPSARGRGRPSPSTELVPVASPSSVIGAGPSGAARAGSAVSTCWWMRDRSLPGSMPSSSASTRRPSANTRSASACRPLRYSAIISSPRIRSRSG